MRLKSVLTVALTVWLSIHSMTCHAIFESQALATAPYEQSALADPYENYNRNAFRMNETLDKNFIRPVAVAYITYMPQPIRSVIQNFFNNLRDFVTLGNDILQLDGISAMHNFMRVSINSTIGILGLLDVSSSLGLPQHTNTFGKTLKTYGWTNSSYFVIPIIGPSTVRDAIGMIPDVFFNPTWWVIPSNYDYVSVGLFVVNGIDTRSKYLDVDQLIYTSLDPYSTLRDIYLQNKGESIGAANSDNNVSIDTLLDEESKPQQKP